MSSDPHQEVITMVVLFPLINTRLLGAQRSVFTCKFTQYGLKYQLFCRMLYKKFAYIRGVKDPEKPVKSAWPSVEIRNVPGIHNTLSYIWITGFNCRQCAVPSTLSARFLGGAVLRNLRRQK